jgi:hypothetical protein
MPMDVAEEYLAIARRPQPPEQTGKCWGSELPVIVGVQQVDVRQPPAEVCALVVVCQGGNSNPMEV